MSESDSLQIESVEDADGITVTMEGEAALIFITAAARKGISPETLVNDVLRQAIADGRL